MNFWRDTNPSGRLLLLVMLATLPVAAPSGASAATIAYASQLVIGGVDFLRVSLDGHFKRISTTDFLPSAGAFAGDDYSTQYIIDYGAGRVASIDVSTGQIELIGIADLGGNTPIGLHWDPTSSQMYAIANDDACTTTTLYVISLANAAAFEVGSTPRCIASLAIDAKGNGFGIDVTEDELVSINIGTGDSATIGTLGFHTSAPVHGLDFDPSTDDLNLFATDDNTSRTGRYLIDTVQGGATLITTYNFAAQGFSLAIQTDAVFSNGFDPE